LSNHFDVIDSKATEFGRITQNNAITPLRSFKVTDLAPIKNSYATSH